MCAHLPELEFTVKTEANCIEYPALEGWDIHVFEMFIDNNYYPNFPEFKFQLGNSLSDKTDTLTAWTHGRRPDTFHCKKKMLG